MLAQGNHYVIGETKPKGPVQPAIWTADNPKDFVNISFLRLDNPLNGWPSDQVKLRRKLIFDALDPRVNLSGAATPHDPSIVEIEELTTDHGPSLSVGAIGYIFVRFLVHPLKLPPNITVTITPTIGGDTYPPITVTRDNTKNALWEVYSDKYVNQSEFTYTMSVEVDGPNFTDDPIIYATDVPVKVPVPAGRVKYIPTLTAPIPQEPAEKTDQINEWCKQAQKDNP
jgi:hypothetical protein